jgi:hypothetical protein
MATSYPDEKDGKSQDVGGEGVQRNLIATRRSARAAADFLEVSKPVVKHTGKQNAQWLKPGLIARVRFLRGEEKLRHATVTDVRVAS